MRAIRNFIYNFSDIFVALIIIALAAFLIWTRIDIIVDSPAKYAASTTTTETTVNTDKGAAAEAGDGATGETTDPGVEYKQVVIPSGSSTDVVAGVLKQAGLVVNVDDFTYQVQQMGVEGQIQAGTHNIPRGSSMEEVIKILCQTTAE